MASQSSASHIASDSRKNVLVCLQLSGCRVRLWGTDCLRCPHGETPEHGLILGNIISVIWVTSSWFANHLASSEIDLLHVILCISFILVSYELLLIFPCVCLGMSLSIS